MATRTPTPIPSSPNLLSPITATVAATPSKRPQPIPWTHQETVNLIQAYQEKWYSIKRGQLRANQWEEVAVVVAARCGYDFNHPSKSAVQCRHKMEKLRQRFRAEKHRLGAPGGGGGCGRTRGWQYFGLMDELERGPLPISARPLVSLVPFCYEDVDEEEGDDDGGGENEGGGGGGDDDDDEGGSYIKSRSTNYILSQRPTRKLGGVSGFSREQIAKRVWRVDDDDDDDDDDEEEEEEEEGVMLNEMGLVSGLAAEMKTFAERFIGMENLKMEMMKETQRCRLEMENKRIEMVLESRQRIFDSIGRAFGSSKRMKMTQEI